MSDNLEFSIEILSEVFFISFQFQNIAFSIIAILLTMINKSRYLENATVSCDFLSKNLKFSILINLRITRELSQL